MISLALTASSTRRRGGPNVARSAAAPTGIGLTVFLSLLLSACKPTPTAGPPRPPEVVVVTVTPTNVPFTGEIIGQLDSPQNVEVRARVEAFVEKVLFTEGTDVKEGDPLFLLDRRPYEEQLANARGQLAQARAALNKYEKDVERLKPLAEKKAIPKQDLDNAEASVQVGQAQVLSAEALEKSALLDLEYCDVRALVSGRIGAKQVSVGELVGKGEPTLLATISTLDPIYFYCSIPEVGYLRIQEAEQRHGFKAEDRPIELFRADGTPAPEKGRIEFFDRMIDPKTGTMRVRAKFQNPGGVMRPGMFGRIRIDLGVLTNSVVVPERAVAELQGRNFVWVIGEGNKASQRGVTVGNPIGDGVLIREGLQPGERIVVEGLQKLREGHEVTPLTPDEMAEQARQAAENAKAEAAARAAAAAEGGEGHGKSKSKGKE